jgi:Ion channel
MLAFVRRTPSATLLLTQLVGILLYPWMESSPAGHTLLTIFGVLVLGVALRVVGRTPWLTWVAFVLAFVIVTLSVIASIAPHPGLTVATATMEAAFYFYATGSLIAYMVQDHVVTTDEFFAAGATFTLLAWAFAYLYVLCQVLLPGSFSGPLETETRTWMELLFLSVAVLSSVGLSDILPVTPLARSLVMLESFAGVMYIALVVSHLISLRTATRIQTTPRETETL